MTFKDFWRQYCWITLFTLFGVALLLGLGTWQLQRLTWKQSILQDLAKKTILPAIDIDKLLQQPLSQIQNAEYRRIKLTGTYMFAHELKLMGKLYKGRPGYHLLTPMVLESGATIIVDRGWIPSFGDVTIERPDETQTVVGFLRDQTSKAPFTPTSNYQTGELYDINTSEIARHQDLMTLLPFFVVAEAPIESNHYPYALGLTTLNIQNHHLQYAIIWFTLAFTLAIFYIIYIRKKT